MTRRPTGEAALVVLKVLYNANDWLTYEDIQKAVPIKLSIVKQRVDRLVYRGFAVVKPGASHAKIRISNDGIAQLNYEEQRRIENERIRRKYLGAVYS